MSRSSLVRSQNKQNRKAKKYTDTDSIITVVHKLKNTMIRPQQGLLMRATGKSSTFRHSYY